MEHAHWKTNREGSPELDVYTCETLQASGRMANQGVKTDLFALLDISFSLIRQCEDVFFISDKKAGESGSCFFEAVLLFRPRRGSLHCRESFIRVNASFFGLRRDRFGLRGWSRRSNPRAHGQRGCFFWALASLVATTFPQGPKAFSVRPRVNQVLCNHIDVRVCHTFL